LKRRKKILRSNPHTSHDRRFSGGKDARAHIGRRGAKHNIRIEDGEWLKIRYNGYTKCFIVYLPKSLGYEEIRERIDKGFGDFS